MHSCAADPKERQRARVERRFVDVQYALLQLPNSLRSGIIMKRSVSTNWRWGFNKKRSGFNSLRSASINLISALINLRSAPACLVPKGRIFAEPRTTFVGPQRHL